MPYADGPRAGLSCAALSLWKFPFEFMQAALAESGYIGAFKSLELRSVFRAPSFKLLSIIGCLLVGGRPASEQ